MDYPQTASMSRPCPSCGGKLLRKTVDPNEPLRMVVCSGCQYQNPISEYMKSVQVTNIAEAKARREKAKAK